MPTVAITLDLACCRCRSKIEKILCSIRERCGFVFDKVEYKEDKILISGSFDAIELICKLRCKASCFVFKIEIVTPPSPPPEKCKKMILIPYPCPYPCPYPYPQPLPCPPDCPKPPAPSCECHSCCKPPPPKKCSPPPPPPPPPCPLEPCPPDPCQPPCRPSCPLPPPCPLPCPPPPPGCRQCPPWTPCKCPGGYPWVVCCEENYPPDGGCAVM